MNLFKLQTTSGETQTMTFINLEDISSIEELDRQISGEVLGSSITMRTGKVFKDLRTPYVLSGQIRVFEEEKSKKDVKNIK